MADTLDFDTAVADIQSAINTIDMNGATIPTVAKMGQFALNVSNIVAGKLELSNPFDTEISDVPVVYPDGLPDMPDLPSSVSTFNIPSTL